MVYKKKLFNFWNYFKIQFVVAKIQSKKQRGLLKQLKLNKYINKELISKTNLDQARNGKKKKCVFKKETRKIRKKNFFIFLLDKYFIFSFPFNLSAIYKPKNTFFN